MDWRQRLMDFCSSLPAAELDHPWGEDAWKIGGKAFAFFMSEGARVMVKAAKENQEALCLDPAVERAPYLGGSGWVVVAATDENSLALAESLLAESHRLVAKGLSRRLRTELGL